MSQNYLSEFNRYLEEDKRCSDITLKAYNSDLAEYFNSLGRNPVNASTADIRRFIDSLREDGRSQSTINRKIASIRSYYHFLLDERRIIADPTHGIKSTRVERSEIEYLTIEEVESLLSLPDDTDKGRRDRALLELMYCTGMRASEVSDANITDINLNIGYISCISQGKKPRMIPLGRPAKAALSEYVYNGPRKRLIGDKADSGALFVNFQGERLTRQGIWKILKFYAGKAGLESKLSPQILRNSFAAHLIMNGADLKSVQELLGHEDIAATKLFLTLSKNRIMDVYDKAFPRA